MSLIGPEAVIQVLLTHPFFWPHVRRGAEREVHDVGTRLVQRGHRVNLVTGQPTGFTSRADVDGIGVRYVRTPLPKPLERRGWRRESTFGAVAAVGAALSNADVVVSYLYADAYGVALTKHLPLPGRRRRPVVLKLTGSVPRSWVADRRLEHGLLRRALDAADAVWVNSPYVVEAMSDWGRRMDVVPAGVDPDVFGPTADRTARPTILCTAAPDEPRKRLVDLLAAWPAIRAGLGRDASLVLAQDISADTRARLLDSLPAGDRASVTFAGRLGDAQLADAYSAAWVTVAPATYEALGLATIESLACGTPVVGADSGATPGLLDLPGTGAGYPPGDPVALAAAVVAVAASAPDPAVRESCRTSALRYAWPAIIDDYERRFTALLGR